ncbi:MAG: SIR2 family NAD-dependent protein deacylase [Nitrososphaerales archaeon]
MHSTLEKAASTIRSGDVVAFTGSRLSESCLSSEQFSSEGGYVTSFAIEAYLSEPRKYWEMWITCRKMTDVPSEAHNALTRLSRLGLLREIITTNVDGLHCKAGSTDIIELNGNFDACRCIRCKKEVSASLAIKRYETKSAVPSCDDCGGVLAPNFINSSETINMELGSKAASNCRTFVIIGASVPSYPCSLFSRIAKKAGAYLVEINPACSPGELIDLRIQGDCTELLNEIVSRVTREI